MKNLGFNKTLMFKKLNLYTVKQLQIRSLDEWSTSREWVIIWSGSASNKKEAKQKALKHINLYVEKE